MQFRFSIWFTFTFQLLTSFGVSEDASTPAKPSQPSRFGFSPPRFVSETSKDREANKKDESATHNAPIVPSQNMFPTLDEMILFQPNKKGEWSPEQLTYTDVDFESADGIKLHAWYCPAETPRAVVLYCHGNAGNIAWLAEFLEFLRATHQLSVFAFDYRGYGKSQGIPTVEGVLADGRAARAKCAEQAGVPSNEVVIWGRSMGGAVAVQLASEERPRALILECTFDSFKTVAKQHAPNWAFLVPDDRLASIQRMPLVTCPLFQAHGMADRVVPFESGKALFAAANEPKMFVKLPNADHNTPTPLGMYNQIDRFLDEKCPKGEEP